MGLRSAKVLNLPANSHAKDSDWEWFWSMYPKKKSKLDALRAWKQTADVRPDIEKIIAAIDTQAQSDQWTRDGGQWIPYPASWLRSGCWDDE